MPQLSAKNSRVGPTASHNRPYLKTLAPAPLFNSTKTHHIKSIQSTCIIIATKTIVTARFRVTSQQSNSTQHDSQRTFSHPMLNPLLCPISLKPRWYQIPPTSLAFNHPATARYPPALKMPPTTFHYATNPTIAESFVSAKWAFLHRTLEFALEALNKPVDFEMYTCIHHIVKMAVGVFQGECVWVREKRSDLHMDFWREIQQ
jgi:hypothetical protein